MTEEESAAYKKAEQQMRYLADDTTDKVFDIVRDLPPAEQKRLVEYWFGDDFYDGYLEWLEE